MTVFWIVAACFIIAALLFVLPPLLQRSEKEKKLPVERTAINATIYQDQLAELESDLRNDMVQPEQYAQGRRELERRLLEDVTQGAVTETAPGAAVPRSIPMAAIVVGVLVPLLAVLLYLQVGNSDALSPQTMADASADAPAGQPHADSAEAVQKMVGDLVERLKQNPQDPEGWAVLGRSLYALGRHAEATQAFSRAAALAPGDAQLLADYADSMAMANGERLDAESIALIHRALQADPSNQKALWLGGTAEFESGNFSAAVKYWERLLKLLPPNSAVSQTMAANIEEARGLASGAPNPSSFPTMNSTAPISAAGNGGASVAGTVSIASTLAGKVAPTDTLFIFARAAQGPRMPLAIMRVQAQNLPLTFSLNDSMAAMPSMKLSSASEVIIGARISKSGDAMPRTGDLQGSSAVVKVGSEGVKIVIDSVAP